MNVYLRMIYDTMVQAKALLEQASGPAPYELVMPRKLAEDPEGFILIPWHSTTPPPGWELAPWCHPTEDRKVPDFAEPLEPLPKWLNKVDELCR